MYVKRLNLVLYRIDAMFWNNKNRLEKKIAAPLTKGSRNHNSRNHNRRAVNIISSRYLGDKRFFTFRNSIYPYCFPRDDNR